MQLPQCPSQESIAVIYILNFSTGLNIPMYKDISLYFEKSMIIFDPCIGLYSPFQLCKIKTIYTCTVNGLKGVTNIYFM